MGAFAKLKRAENQFAAIQHKILNGFNSDQNPVQSRTDARTGDVSWYWPKGNSRLAQTVLPQPNLLPLGQGADPFVPR